MGNNVTYELILNKVAIILQNKLDNWWTYVSEEYIGRYNMGIKHICLQPANWFTYVCSEEKNGWYNKCYEKNGFSITVHVCYISVSLVIVHVLIYFSNI